MWRPLVSTLAIFANRIASLPTRRSSSTYCCLRAPRSRLPLLHRSHLSPSNQGVQAQLRLQLQLKHTAATAVTATHSCSRSPRLATALFRACSTRTTTPTTHGHDNSSSSEKKEGPGKMASDADYMAFLDKANKDPGEGYAAGATTTKAQQHELKTTDAGAQVPQVLVEATKDAFYVSDADEPFVPVCLGWDEGGKGLPDEEEFARLVGHPEPTRAEADVEIMDPVDWDRRGQYAELVDAVRQASRGGDVRVYRVARGGARAEYWVVTTEGEGGAARLVGVRAKAVES